MHNSFEYKVGNKVLVFRERKMSDVMAMSLYIQKKEKLTVLDSIAMQIAAIRQSIVTKRFLWFGYSETALLKLLTAKQVNEIFEKLNEIEGMEKKKTLTE